MLQRERCNLVDVLLPRTERLHSTDRTRLLLEYPGKVGRDITWDADVGRRALQPPDEKTCGLAGFRGCAATGDLADAGCNTFTPAGHEDVIQAHGNWFFTPGDEPHMHCAHEKHWCTDVITSDSHYTPNLGDDTRSLSEMIAVCEFNGPFASLPFLAVSLPHPCPENDRWKQTTKLLAATRCSS